jgi:hypothetical protein
VLWDTIVSVREYRKKQGKTGMPRRLVVTLDNTTKQNKGRYLAAFLSLLVRQNVFEEIYMKFLPKGHTHDNVDQVFSRLSVYLRRHNVMNRNAFAKAIRRAYRNKRGQRAKVIQWSTIGNVSGWMEEIGVKELTGVQREKWRNFRFRKIRGKTRMQVRSNLRVVAGDEWRGTKDGSAFYDCFRGCDYEDTKFVAAVREGRIPDAQRTDPCQSKIPISQETREKRWNKREKELHRLRKALPFLFKERDLADCLEILKLERTTEPEPFDWDADTVYKRPCPRQPATAFAEPCFCDRYDIMGSDVEELSAPDEEEASDAVPEHELHSWAGHPLPARHTVWLVRDDADFKVYRVNYRCKSVKDTARYRKAAGEKELPHDVPSDCTADDPLYCNLAYACEELVSQEDPVEGTYKTAGYDTALVIDSTWQAVNMTGAKTAKSGMKLHDADKKKIREWLAVWRDEADEEEEVQPDTIHNKQQTTHDKTTHT